MFNKNLSIEDIGFYDDPNSHYQDFWTGRDYEHLSEVIAIKKLLGTDHFKTAIDYGGGYGRLSRILLSYVDQLYLVDPSIKQLDLARKRIPTRENVEFVQLKRKNHIPTEDSIIDLLIMVRVSHHLVEPAITFSEIYRVLKPGGRAIIEIANSNHFLNRLRMYSKLKRIPLTPLKIGKASNGITEDTPFVNHNPHQIATDLNSAGLKIVRKLSVSNLRNESLKKLFSLSVLVAIESVLQVALSPVDFGPSVFMLVEKMSDFEKILYKSSEYPQ
jgi:ubiquinone/menaquinone biosynthesis C-methylase UbiE